MPRYGGQDARAPIFMHGGEPKDHEVFAQNDRLESIDNRQSAIGLHKSARPLLPYFIGA
jgi:hypothetical protein